MHLSIRKVKSKGKKPNYCISIVQYEGGERVLNQTLSVKKYLGLNRPAEYNEAQKVLRELQADVSKGELVKESGRLFESYAREWLEGAGLYLKEHTHVVYERQMRLHILPVIGKKKLKDITPTHIRKIFAEMDGYGGGTKRYVHAVINSCMKSATEEGLIRANPVERVKRPRKDDTQIEYLEWLDAQRLIEGTKEDRNHLYFCIALSTGMGRAEILGLKWQDIDFKAKTISVRNTCVRGRVGVIVQSSAKTKSRLRTLDVSPWLLTKVQEHKKKQELEMEALGYANEDDLVFTSLKGGPLRPDNMSVALKRFLKKLNLPHIGTHGLRHTYATRLLELGVHPKVVSERLGHSSIDQTINTYSHVSPRLAREVAIATDPE